MGECKPLVHGADAAFGVRGGNGGGSGSGGEGGVSGGGGGGGGGGQRVGAHGGSGGGGRRALHGMQDAEVVDVAGQSHLTFVVEGGGGGRGLHSFPFQLKMSSSIHRTTNLPMSPGVAQVEL